MTITVLGLGPGDPDLLTRAAWNRISSARELVLRTREHPVVPALPENIRVESFDRFYRDAADFQEVYDRIVARLLELGNRPEGVIYAVPGHPLVAESTVTELLRRARNERLRLQIIDGLSFVEPTLTALGLDLLPQTAIVDALEIAAVHYPLFPPDAPALLAQLYSPAVAADVKLTLMEAYPDEHPVYLVHAAGSGSSAVEQLPLHELDRSSQIGALTTLYVPALGPATSFEAFHELIAHLRAPEGCPWDREQTHLSLRPFLLEETYETLEALDAQDPNGLMEELGDLLIQIVLHAQIASEAGEFRMTDVLRHVYEKLVRRHPHVFAGVEVSSVADIRHNWERLKADERSSRGEEPEKSVLSGVSEALPALAQAAAYQQRVVQVGFDWPNIHGVLDKVREEFDEVLSAEDEQARSDEIGDLLFSVVNLARWYGVDAEVALRGANRRFRNRFERLEQRAREQGRSLKEMSLEEMDELWEQTK